MYAKLRIDLTNEMHMVGHDLKFDDFNLQLDNRLAQDLLKSFLNPVH